MKFDYELEYFTLQGGYRVRTYGWELTGRVKYVHTLGDDGEVYTTLYLEASKMEEIVIPDGDTAFFGLFLRDLKEPRLVKRWFKENMLRFRPVPNVEIYYCNTWPRG